VPRPRLFTGLLTVGKMPQNQKLKDRLIETGKSFLNPLGSIADAFSQPLPKKSAPKKSAPKKSAPKKSARDQGSHPPLALKGHGMEPAAPGNKFAPKPHNKGRKAKVPPDPRVRATVNRGKRYNGKRGTGLNPSYK